MAIDYEYDERRRLLRTRISGTVTANDIRAYLAKLDADERVQGEVLEFVDMTEVETLTVTVGDVESVVRADREAASRRSKRMAIVATKDVTFGLARMYALMGEASGTPLDVRVYRERLPAERWLLGP